MRKKFINKIVSVFVTAGITASMLCFGMSQASAAFDMDDLKKDDRLSLGYSIINGYSKLSEKSGLTSYKRTAVYSGLNLKNPYLMALAGGFYLANGVDLERTLNDNDYALSLIKKLDGFLGVMRIKNDRALKLKEKLKDDGVKILDSYDCVGLYIIEAGKDYAEKLMKNDLTDFVFSGGAVPPSMKDLNMDGKSDKNDIALIQKYLAGKLKYKDDDIQNYLGFAADINGDKYQTIDDVTEIQRAR